MAGSTTGTVGIGVSDLDQSTNFCTRVLGMTEMQRYKLPILTGSASPLCQALAMPCCPINPKIWPVLF